MNKTSRSAGVYACGGQLLIHPYRQTTAGVLITGTPVTMLQDAVSDEELGSAVSAALRMFKFNVPHPSPADIDRMPDPILEAMRAKRWATLSKRALYCSVVEEDSALTVTPSRKTHPPGAYLSIPDRDVILTLPAVSSQIGAAVREALSRCNDA